MGRAGGPAAAVLLFAASLPVLASPDADSVRDLLRRGDRAKALENARALVATSPADVESHLLYQDAARGQMPPNALQAEYRSRLDQSPGGESAYLYSRLLPAPEAEKLLRDAVRSEPRSYWAQVGLSSALGRLGRASPAEQAALAAMELRPGDPRAAARAGDQCAAARRWPSAEACFRKALDGDPSRPGYRLGLAHALLRQGKLDDADAALRELRNPAKPEARVLLLDAALAAERGDLAGAERALVQVTAVDPNDQDAIVQLALLRLKKAEAAPRPAGRSVDKKTVAGDLAALEKASTILPERADIRYAMGFAHEITGDADGALEDYRQASRLDPLDGDVIVAAAALLVGKSQLEEAAHELQRALDRDPEDTGALFQLGCVLDQQGKPEEAIKIYRRLVKAEPTGARGWHLLGMALHSTKKPQEAAGAFQKAAELDPKTARHYRDLGEALHECTGYSKAAEALEKAVALDPKDGLAWAGLGRARGQLKRYAAAVEAYQKAAELRPADKDLHLLMGAYCQEYLKEHEKALLHYNKYVQLGGDAGDVEEWIVEAQAEIEKKLNDK